MKAADSHLGPACLAQTFIANENCRVLVLPRDKWQAILLDNPDGAKIVLNNLQVSQVD